MKYHVQLLPAKVLCLLLMLHREYRHRQFRTSIWLLIIILKLFLYSTKWIWQVQCLKRLRIRLLIWLAAKGKILLKQVQKPAWELKKFCVKLLTRIPPPEGNPDAPLQALIFDSIFNSFRGIIAYIKIVNGTIRKGDKVKFVNTDHEYNAEEIGVLKLKQDPRDIMGVGDVGYIISGIKISAEVKVGDTITHVKNPCDKAISGFEDVKPMVFAGIYPVDADDYEDLRISIEKLQLNDASLSFIPESSAALGFGFRCGFLGLLHMEIIQERLDREFDMDVITTVPNVSFKAYTTKGEEIDVHNPSGLPPVNHLERIEEPYIIAQVITLSEYVGSIMNLCIDKRGVLKNQVYLTTRQG